MTLIVRVVTPDKIVWESEVQEAILPSTSGQLGVLSSHAPLLTALDTGVIRVRPDKDWKSIAVMGGFAEVEQDEIQVLVRSAEVGDDIDKEQAKAEYDAAQTRLEEASKSGEVLEQIKATSAFKRARARLQASGGLV